MENAADALKMAGFMLIFIAALSLAMTTLSKAKSAAAVIINSNNKRNDYSYLNEEPAYPVEGTNRLVGIETIIPHIYSYTKESYRVEFYQSNGNALNIVPTNLTKLPEDSEGNAFGEIIGGKCYINFLDLAWESTDTRSIDQKNNIMETLKTRYKDRKFIEQLDEQEEETDDEDEYLQKNEESKDKLRILSYTLK